MKCGAGAYICPPLSPGWVDDVSLEYTPQTPNTTQDSTEALTDPST
jgi:hypothetical protein